MKDFLIQVYRVNPFRPHCNGSIGHHVWLCRYFMGTDAGDEDCRGRR